METIGELKAVSIGFSKDKRKRRNQHRTAALNILRSGGFFNCFSARGTTLGNVAAWHIRQALVLTNHR